jgi:hypothetical protein
MNYRDSSDNLYDNSSRALTRSQIQQAYQPTQSSYQPTQSSYQPTQSSSEYSDPVLDPDTRSCEMRCHSFMSTLKLEFTIVIFILSWINYGIFFKYKNNIKAKTSDKDAVANTGIGLGVCSALLLIAGVVSYFKKSILIDEPDSLTISVIGLLFGITVLILSAINFGLATKILPNSEKRNYNEDTIWNTSLGLLICCSIIFIYSIYDFIQSYSYYKNI